MADRSQTHLALAKVEEQEPLEVVLARLSKEAEEEGQAEHEANGGSLITQYVELSLTKLSHYEQALDKHRGHVVARQEEELRAIAERHAEQLVGLDDEIAKARDAIGALQGKEAPSLKALARAKRAGSTNGRRTQPKRTGVKTGGGTATGQGISLEAAAQCAAVIKRVIAAKQAAGKQDTRVTQKEIYRDRDLDWDQTKGSKAFLVLLDLEFLRKNGVIGRAQGYSIMDEDAVDKELERVAERTQRYQRRDFDDGTDNRDRIREVLKQVGSITGIENLATMADVPRGSMRDLLVGLEEDELIHVDRPEKKGRPLVISTLEG
jgi:hypothetical protein